MPDGNPTDSEGNRSFETNPVVVVQGVGQIGRSFLAEIGGIFWFIVSTFAETADNVRRGRVPFRAASFFRHTERAGVGSVPLYTGDQGAAYFFAAARRAWRNFITEASTERRSGALCARASSDLRFRPSIISPLRYVSSTAGWT